MSQQCSTHRKQSITTHLTLFGLLAAGLSFLVWHVWKFGPTVGGKAALESKPFLFLVFQEIWGVIFDNFGLIAQLKEIWIYFFIGILIDGFIRTYKFHIRLRKTLINYGAISIVLASLIGVFSPLCACGILTTVVGLLASGLPLAPAMSLLIAAPLMSPTTFFLTNGDLGAEWAVMRTIVAFLMGIFAGVVTHLLRKHFEVNLFVEGGIPEGDFHDHDYADERLRCTCREKFSNRIAVKYKNKFIIFCAKTLEMTWMLGKYIVVGIFVGRIAARYVPNEIFVELFSSKNPLSIVWITVGSIPLYLHQISASSVLYNIKGTLPGTLNKGAALAFLIGGPVTAIPAMALLWAMFKKRVFALYMGISVIGTLLFAYSFNAFVFIPNIDEGNPIFENVGKVPNGEASVLEKSHNYVHVIADPGDKAMIAVYNDIEGGTSLAFDSSLVRFMNDSYEKESNNQYIKNLAKWLESTTMLGAKKSILVYNTYDGSGYDLNNFNQNIPRVLNNPYSVKVTDRLATPQITPELLASYNQVWVINGGKHSAGVLTAEELSAISNFRDSGGAVLLAAGPGEFTSDVNQISNNYGVKFSGSSNGSKILPVSLFGDSLKKPYQNLSNFFKSMISARDGEERATE